MRIVATGVLVAVAGCAATFAHAQGCLGGATTDSYPLGGDNRAIASADFDGDGMLDVAIGSFTSGSVEVILNSGDGTFGPTTSYSMMPGGVLYGIAAGDVNGDGAPDLVAPGYSANEIAIRLNTGTGTFGASSVIAGPGGAITPSLRDLDGDGDLDLITTNYSASTVSVFMNSGGGAFGGATQYAVGGAPQGLEVADVNGDGAPDVLTADIASSSVSVLLNNGSGGLLARSAYPTAAGPYSVVVADFNGDHKADFATANFNGASLTVYLGDGAGNFGGRQDVAGVASHPGACAADVDGDGDVDLVASGYSSGGILVLLNDGQGSLPTRTTIDTPGAGGHYTFTRGDFTGFGRDEFAVAGRWGGVTVWRGGTCSGRNPISVYACATGSASFDVPARAGVGYQWELLNPGGTWVALQDGVLTRPDGTALIAGAGTPRLEMSLALTPGAEGGAYRCVMTDAGGTLVSAPGLLSLNGECPTLGVAGPRAVPVVSADRVAPGNSSATYQYAGLVVDEGTSFELGSGETLDLSGGRGTLFIRSGAVFIGNGLILGNVWNEGLIRIPITGQGWVGPVRGGIVRLWPIVPPSPVDPIVPIAPVQPPVVPPETGVVIGPGGPVVPGGPGGGGGGGGGSFTGGGGTYRIVAPGVEQQGQLSMDATLEVTGWFQQAPSGVLRLVIAGEEPGETFNQLRVGEYANIDGTIQVLLDPVMFDFTPSVGQSFDMVIADGGITLAPGLELKTMITAAGAEALGLELPAFVSPFSMDPDEMVEFPLSIFDMQVVDGTTLRFTLNQPVCAAQPLVETRPVCGRDTAEFRVKNPGSGPLTYQWQIEDGPLSENWSDVEPGFYGWLGTVQTPTGRSMTIRKPRYYASGTRFRCVVSGPCATIVTEPAALSVLQQTEEECGNCPVCVADFDDNGGVDGADLALFFGAYEAGETCADVDFNGGVDGADLAGFFVVYEIGGCD